MTYQQAKRAAAKRSKLTGLLHKPHKCKNGKWLIAPPTTYLVTL